MAIAWSMCSWWKGGRVAQCTSPIRVKVSIRFAIRNAISNLCGDGGGGGGGGVEQQATAEPLVTVGNRWLPVMVVLLATAVGGNGGGGDDAAAGSDGAVGDGAPTYIPCTPGGTSHLHSEHASVMCFVFISPRHSLQMLWPHLRCFCGPPRTPHTTHTFVAGGQAAPAAWTLAAASFAIVTRRASAATNAWRATLWRLQSLR